MVDMKYVYSINMLTTNYIVRTATIESAVNSMLYNMRCGTPKGVLGMVYREDTDRDGEIRRVPVASVTLIPEPEDV